MEFLFSLIAWSVIFGGLGYAVSGQDGKAFGVMIGVLLGPIGVLIAAVLNK